MITIGLLREGKVPADNRVALTPAQCKWIHRNAPDVRIMAQALVRPLLFRQRISAAGVEVTEDISGCAILLGIKEVPVKELLPARTYLFFSHTHKQQSYNQACSGPSSIKTSP